MKEKKKYDPSWRKPRKEPGSLNVVPFKITRVSFKKPLENHISNTAIIITNEMVRLQKVVVSQRNKLCSFSSTRVNCKNHTSKSQHIKRIHFDSFWKRVQSSWRKKEMVRFSCLVLLPHRKVFSFFSLSLEFKFQVCSQIYTHSFYLF
jgi:hypothetical protein